MTATGYTGGDPRKLDRTGYTKGDVVAADAAGALTAVPVGADTEVLTADSTDAEGVDWAAGGGGAGTPSNTVVAETSYGQVSTAGLSGTYSRGDHSHGSPSLTAAAPATTEGIGQAAAVGVAATPARADHVHPLAAAAAPAGSAVGDTQATGAATTFAASDHRHSREAFGAVTAETTFGQAASDGAATTVARSDHTHGTPAAPSVPSASGTVAAETSYGAVSNAGAAATFSRGDHTHGSPSLGTTGAAAAAGNDARLRDAPPYPASGYGLLAISADPMHHQGSAGFGNNQLWATRLWIPANVVITNLHVAVRVAGTHDGTNPNQIGLYDDTGAQVDTTADDNTLWTVAGWRGGALQGGPVAAQPAGRYVYVVWLLRGMSGTSLPFPTNADDANAAFVSTGVGGGNRRAMYASGTALPASFNPTSFGTSTGFLSLVGVS